jgi:hypothetical protein
MAFVRQKTTTTKQNKYRHARAHRRLCRHTLTQQQQQLKQTSHICFQSICFETSKLSLPHSCDEVIIYYFLVDLSMIFNLFPIGIKINLKCHLKKYCSWRLRLGMLSVIQFSIYSWSWGQDTGITLKLANFTY